MVFVICCWLSSEVDCLLVHASLLKMLHKLSHTICYLYEVTTQRNDVEGTEIPLNLMPEELVIPLWRVEFSWTILIPLEYKFNFVSHILDIYSPSCMVTPLSNSSFWNLFLFVGIFVSLNPLEPSNRFNIVRSCSLLFWFGCEMLQNSLV